MLVIHSMARGASTYFREIIRVLGSRWNPPFLLLRLTSRLSGLVWYPRSLLESFAIAGNYILPEKAVRWRGSAKGDIYENNKER